MFTDVSPTVRTASFSLKQSKQVNKIREDAKLNDYEVTVNNGDQNVTIKCSSGFYIQVAKASFALDRSSSLSTGKIGISVDEIIITKDQNSLEATMLIHFSFKHEQARSGGVSVHLHHSSRTIQMQGSHIMPDSVLAPVWFLENVVLKRFKDIAKAKRFAVKKFNEAAKNIKLTRTAPVPSPSGNNCQSCNLIFNMKSKPSQCQSCLKFFHKNCLKDHSKLCRNSSSSLPAPSSSSSLGTTNRKISAQTRPSTDSSNGFNKNQTLQNSLPSAPVSSAASLSIPGLQSSLSFVSSAMSFGSTTTTSMAGTSQHQLAMPAVPAVSSSSRATSSLPGTSSSLESQHPLSQPSLSSTTIISKPSGKQVMKKKQNPIPVSASEHSIEILEKELSAAQAKIVLLDNQIKDKDQERAVLWARIKILEEKQNAELLDKYFPFADVPVAPSQSSSGGPSSSPPLSRQTCSCQATVRCNNQPCCSSQGCSAPSACSRPMWLTQPPCHHCPHSQCHSQVTSIPESTVSNQAADLSKEVEKTRLEVKSMEKELKGIKNLLASYEEGPTPSAAQNTFADIVNEAGTSAVNVPGTSAVNIAGTSANARTTPSGLNDSVASIEEFISEPHSSNSTSTQHLNLKLPTSQL